MDNERRAGLYARIVFVMATPLPDGTWSVNDKGEITVVSSEDFASDYFDPDPADIGG